MYLILLFILLLWIRNPLLGGERREDAACGFIGRFEDPDEPISIFCLYAYIN